MEVLRGVATSARFTFAVYAAIAGIFLAATYQLLSVWLLSQQLHAEVKLLSSHLLPHTAPTLVDNKDMAQDEIQGLARSALSMARSENVDKSKSSELLAQRPMSSVSSTAKDRTRLTLESLVMHALPLRVEVTALQDTQPLTSMASDQDIVTSVRGTYSDVRSWLMQVTDADSELLLKSVRFRRESPRQPHIGGEIRLARIGLLSGPR